jgi:hypothetical protein
MRHLLAELLQEMRVGDKHRRGPKSGSPGVACKFTWR